MVNELSPLVVGKHFDRIRKLGDGIYRLKIGSTEILCELGIRIHFTKYIEQSNETDKFAEKVGKELDNAKLKAIKQINNDRIIVFEFDRGQLVFEMFGDGNAILIRDSITITAVKFESWTGREIKSGSPYSPPKNLPSNKLELSDKYVIVSLMKLPLGKEYATEILQRLKIDEKKSGSSLSGNQILALESEINKIKSSPMPLVFFDPIDSTKPVDFSLTTLSKHSKLKTQNFKTLSEAADEYYSRVEKPNPKIVKLLSRLEKQQERLEGLLQEEKEFKVTGDRIYAEYVAVENLLQLAKSGKFEELEKKYNTKIDKKEKTIEVGV
jgi:predicted ribosome quality control (RQC) complex YloA/Tae2 family protein